MPSGGLNNVNLTHTGSNQTLAADELDGRVIHQFSVCLQPEAPLLVLSMIQPTKSFKTLNT